MTSGRAPVSVVIVTWNSERFVDACLSSLRSLVRPPEEIVVVDCGSRDETIEKVGKDFPEAQLVACTTNVGYCRANNIGIARTESPFVLALNPDTRLTPTFLEELLPAFEDPRVGIAAPKLLRFDGKTLDSAGQRLGRSRQPLDRGYGAPDRGEFEADEEVFGACGAAALYRRRMLQAIGDADGEVFDEAFFAFYEDLDVAWRARKLGWKALYRHRAVGYHARGGTSSKIGPGRFRSMQGRAPELRYHIVKNRYLTILRNDTAGGYLANLPFILARDAATLPALLFTSPGVLLRLAGARSLFRDALRKRRLDSARPRHQL